MDNWSQLHSANSIDVNLGHSHNHHAKPSDFEILAIIGKGTYGKVLLAKLKSDSKFYAVKVLQKKIILKKKELFYHLQREHCFSEPRARFYTAELASAIGYLHSHNIVYRDLKPENVLLDSEGHVVLTDFGLCKEGIDPESTTSTFCGTPEYLAPEVLKQQPYDHTVDWWCLGTVLYEMIYGLPPFYSQDMSEMYDNILHRPLSLPGGASSVACDLLMGLLQKDQHRRLGAIADFLEVKNHTFFSPINWDDLYHRRIKPPYNPNVKGPADMQHIDPEFTKEMVSGSVGVTPEFSNLSTSSPNAFTGFSYVSSDDNFL
uniref:Serum/glucocorticoid regulated kinase 2 n=1 Tax=Salmo trutta TaxID=8032 RepID=A0A674E8N0_SALTR